MSSGRSEFGQVDIVGCSVRGQKHEDAGEECQDYGAKRQLGDGWFLVGVADGLGSASDAAVGSETAVETALDYLEEKLSDVSSVKNQLVEKWVKSAFSTARAKLQGIATEHEKPVSEFQTTLQVVVGTPSGVAGAAVGDGGIVCEQRGELRPLVSRERSVRDIEMYANATTSLQSDEWEKSYRFEFAEVVAAVAVFSDGLSNLVWGRNGSIQTGVIDQTLQSIRESDDADDLETELCEFLQSQKIRQRSRDDKTLYAVSVPGPVATTETDSSRQSTPRERVSEPWERLASLGDAELSPVGQRQVAEALNDSLSAEFDTDDFRPVAPVDTPPKSDLGRTLPTLIVIVPVIFGLVLARLTGSVGAFSALVERTSVALGGGATLFGTTTGGGGLQVTVWMLPAAITAVVTATVAVTGSPGQFLHAHLAVLPVGSSQGDSTGSGLDPEAVERVTEEVAAATSEQVQSVDGSGDEFWRDAAVEFLESCLDEPELPLTVADDGEKTLNTLLNGGVVAALIVVSAFLAVPLADLSGAAATLVQYLPNVVVLAVLVSWVVVASHARE